jgi:hypothetical protein
MKKPVIIISLTGGLGNQLFQLAAGLNFAKGKNLILSSAFGKPRQNNRGKTELLSFKLPSNVLVLESGEAPWVTRKIAGYLLRLGAAPKGVEIYNFFSRIACAIASYFFIFFFKQYVAITYSKNLGFAPIKIKNGNNLMFGYFQTFRWVENPVVKNTMMDMHLKSKSNNLDIFKALSDIEKPIVVHVRLGDYQLEQHFGTLSKNYYKLGIEKVMESNICKSIWLFSDDIDEAKKLLPCNIDIPVRLIDQIDDSASVTFEVMRLGFGYVIANSTFSWWAAYLSRNQGVEIIAPKPWFKGTSEPLDLIPKEWERIEGNIFKNTL